ncbi:MtrB/PioB family outer membrane beta-barrel protein [Candidatus Poribacteria bacterium]|nr:MtrB/PioB family outer membrane beta-barrel protein [Candidatus Poribacteria bacterium]
MKAARRTLSLVLAIALLLVGAFTPAVADPLEDLNNWYYPYTQQELDGWYYGQYSGGYLRGGATYYNVSGDDGRFREDRFISDQLTGGLEQFSYSRENWNVSITAIAEDFYAASGHYEKPDVVRLDFDFSRHRKYYDRLSEKWNPALYGLTTDFAEDDDDDLFADRVDANLQGTLLLPDIPHVVLGWHHWERFGDEVLARGGIAISTTPGVPFGSFIPIVNDVDGRSDTVYLEIPVTLKDKYNFKLREEYEDFNEDQESVETTFVNGAPTSSLIFDDSPEWNELRTLFSFDSFITENVYLSANYYRSDLNNEFERDALTPPISLFSDNDVNNDQTSNAFALGLVLLNVAKDTTFRANFRAEDLDIDGDSDGLLVSSPVTDALDKQETRLGEFAEVIWKGLENTTVSVQGEWEQRFIDQEEVVENNFSRDADIDYDWQQYTFTIVNRPRSDLRLMARYRFRDNEEDYDENFDIDPTAYPGNQGDLMHDVHKLTLKGDWRFLPAWTTTIEYQFEDEERQFDNQSADGQDSKIHRVSTSVYGAPMARLSLSGMATYENFKLDTPVDAPVGDFGTGGNAWADGEGPFDFRYESYILFLSSRYAIDEKWATNLSYQHTQNTGKDVDNDLDEVWLGAEYQLTEDKIISARYEYFNFEDTHHNGFDDYRGHGIYLALAYRF